MSPSPVPTRALGPEGLAVPAIGLGCMGMSETYGPVDDAESIATIHRALELGVFLLDTANVYGGGHNEQLVGKAIAGRREEVVVGTKFAMVHGPGGARGVNGRPEYVKSCCDESLGRLGTDHIDLYYQHRVDPTVPIEETVGAMAELVAAGKVGSLGLCEVSSATLRRAHAIHPITALQSEWSLWVRDLEDDVAATARELDIGIVPFSPLGRGFLAGTIASPDALDEKDSRRKNERFQAGNFDTNRAALRAVFDLAEARGVTPAQLALAWVCARGPDVVPIPGTKRRRYIEENAAACSIQLDEAELAALEAATPSEAWRGLRNPGGSYDALYPGQYGETPPLGS